MYEDDEDEPEIVLPTIDQVLPAFLAEHTEGVRGVKLRRIHQLHTELREYLESNVGPGLTDSEATVLAAEREFDPNGAVCRVLAVDVLLEALAGFVRQPNLAEDLLLRKAQLDLVESLSWHICYSYLRGMDASCLQIHIEVAVSQAERDLKRERREQTRARREARPEFRAALESARSQLAHDFPNEEWPPAGCTADELRAAMRNKASAATARLGAQAQNLSAE